MTEIPTESRPETIAITTEELQGADVVWFEEGRWSVYEIMPALVPHAGREAEVELRQLDALGQVLGQRKTLVGWDHPWARISTLGRGVVRWGSDGAWEDAIADVLNVDDEVEISFDGRVKLRGRLKSIHGVEDFPPEQVHGDKYLIFDLLTENGTVVGGYSSWFAFGAVFRRKWR